VSRCIYGQTTYVSGTSIKINVDGLPTVRDGACPELILLICESDVAFFFSSGVGVFVLSLRRRMLLS
jgi:hypothetical protein